MCFVWIWEQTAIISPYNINWLVCITETECVYCAVRTGSLYIIHISRSLLWAMEVLTFIRHVPWRSTLHGDLRHSYPSISFGNFLFLRKQNYSSWGRHAVPMCNPTFLKTNIKAYSLILCYSDVSVALSHLHKMTRTKYCHTVRTFGKVAFLPSLTIWHLAEGRIYDSVSWRERMNHCRCVDRMICVDW